MIGDANGRYHQFDRMWSTSTSDDDIRKRGNNHSNTTITQSRQFFVISKFFFWLISTLWYNDNWFWWNICTCKKIAISGIVCKCWSPPFNQISLRSNSDKWCCNILKEQLSNIYCKCDASMSATLQNLFALTFPVLLLFIRYAVNCFDSPEYIAFAPMYISLISVSIVP